MNKMNFQGVLPSINSMFRRIMEMELPRFKDVVITLIGESYPRVVGKDGFEVFESRSSKS
jgi:hypothetical protein